MAKYESDRVINHYERKSALRTASGVLSALFSMGIPISLTELLRSGGDIKVAFWAGVCALIAIVLAVVSIRGTMKQ